MNAAKLIMQTVRLTEYMYIPNYMLITCNLLKRRVIFFSEKFHDKAIFNSLAYSNDLYNITISSQKK